MTFYLLCFFYEKEAEKCVSVKQKGKFRRGKKRRKEEGGWESESIHYPYDESMKTETTHSFSRRLTFYCKMNAFSNDFFSAHFLFFLFFLSSLCVFS